MASLIPVLFTLAVATSHPHSNGLRQTARITIPPEVQLGERADGRADSVSLVWQAPDVDAPFAVKFSQGGEMIDAPVSFKTIRVEGIEPHRVYTAVLSKLRAGTKIDYKVLAGTETLYSASVMAPKSDRQAYHFAVFGDCGVAGVEQAEVAYQAYMTKPDMVLLTGDLVYGSGLVSQYRSNFFPYYTAEMASPKNGAPLFDTALTVAAPGNHDILNRNLAQSPQVLAYYYYWKQPLNGPIHTVGAPSSPTLSGPEDRQKAFLENAGPAYPCMSNYSFDYGNAHWTVLDANSYVDWSNPELRKWLADDLAKGAKKTWRFVMYHQPGFHSARTHQGEKQMRLVADIFEQGKVDVVFNGHVHNYQRSKPIQVGTKAGAVKTELAKDDWGVDSDFDGVTKTHPKGIIYVVTGAGGAGLYNPEMNDHPETWKPYQATYHSIFSFSSVEIDGKTFRLKQIDKDGKEIDSFTITK